MIPRNSRAHVVSLAITAQILNLLLTWEEPVVHTGPTERFHRQTSVKAILCRGSLTNLIELLTSFLWEVEEGVGAAPAAALYQEEVVKEVG